MKTFLKVGLILGSIDSLLLLASQVNISGGSSDAPLHKAHALAGLLSILTLILGVYFGIEEIKKKNPGGFSYKLAVLSGIKITGITAAFISIFSLFYCTVINSGFTGMMVKDVEKLLLASGATAEEMSIRLEHVKNEFSASTQVIRGLVLQLVLGTLASLLIGLSLRTRNS